MDIVIATFLLLIDPVSQFINQPWWVTTLWLVYAFILFLLFRSRFADGQLRRYACAYGQWYRDHRDRRAAIYKARALTAEAQEDETQDVEAAQAELAALCTLDEKASRPFDRDLSIRDDWWYSRWFKSPRSIALIMTLLSILWPVEAVVRPLYYATRWALGLDVLRTVRAVITLKD